ncbi:hypothetical protein PHMEG_00010394 [Phytophthora megakarya]|uniref:Uncharacterized protein n=1 Tax=Phytophthora megakarya TaxID=4795 RepID=A0A225WF60_9STRA|nr:hypothetical protein PHMEG_00010394 [Phytophthora megakarya]
MSMFDTDQPEMGIIARHLRNQQPRPDASKGGTIPLLDTNNRIRIGSGNPRDCDCIGPGGQQSILLATYPDTCPIRL